jgi:hypothetical protein
MKEATLAFVCLSWKQFHSAMGHTVGKVTKEILELSLGGAQDNLFYRVQ